jgi:hypothetical protein
VFTALKMSIVVLWAETPSDFVGWTEALKHR